MVLLVCGVLLLVMGVLMVAVPKLFIKKNATVSDEHLRQVKKSGITEVVSGVVLLIVGFIIG